MQTILEVFLYLNIPIVIISILFGLILITYQTRAHWFLGLTCLTVGLWGATVVFSYYIHPDHVRDIVVRSSFFFGVFIPFFFFLFTNSFFQGKKVSRFTIGFLAILTLIMGFLAFSKYFEVSSRLDYPVLSYEKISGAYLAWYGGYFLIAFLVFFINLLGKINLMDGIMKESAQRILLASAVAIVINLFVSIFFYFFYTTELSLFGVFSSLFFLVYVAYTLNFFKL